MKKFLKLRKMFVILFVVMISELYTYAKITYPEYFKYGQFIVWELCFNKFVFMKNPQWFLKVQRNSFM